MARSDMNQEIIDTTKVVTIGVSGVTYTFLGLPFGDWAAIATALYMFFSAILILPKVYAQIKSWVTKDETRS